LLPETDRDNPCSQQGFCLKWSSSFAAAVGIRKGAFVVYRAEEKPDVSIRLPSDVDIPQGDATLEIKSLL
jgi:hypothetical protein